MKEKTTTKKIKKNKFNCECQNEDSW